MRDWLDILRQAVADNHGNLSAVSRLLVGTTSKRPAISMALSGKYYGDAAKLEALVRERFERNACPYLGREIGQTECLKYADASVPTSSPHAVRHWRACQQCRHKEAS
ncbi:MAG: LacI family transcriptional regulator [Sulfuricellaceae bacterium]